MSNQWKSDGRNSQFTCLAVHTCVPVMEGMKLCCLQSSRLQRKRMGYSTVSANRNGRVRPPQAKAVIDILSNCDQVSTFPVSCQLHGTKDIWDNSGDLAVSVNMPGRS